MIATDIARKIEIEEAQIELSKLERQRAELGIEIDSQRQLVTDLREKDVWADKEAAMKHARQIRAGDVEVGMRFRFSGGTFVDDRYVEGEYVATVTDVTFTKTGRVRITTDRGRWANGPIAPGTRLQG